MQTRTVWCEECQKRAEGYLVPENQDAHCVQNVRFHDDNKLDGFVIARDTSARMEGTYKQDPIRGKRPVIWRPEHRFSVGLYSWDSWDESTRVHTQHISVRNHDASRSHAKLLCQLPETITLTGPGAQAHSDADAAAVAAVTAKRDLEARAKAKLKAESAETEAFAAQIASVLKTLGIEVNHATMAADFFNDDDKPRKPKHFYISMDLQTAVRVVEAMGGTVARPPTDPMPLWKVWYGKNKDEDREPLYVAARTQPAVIAHMTKHYVHEHRPGDEENIPLKPELLIIEPAGDDPKVPAEDADENAA